MRRRTNFSKSLLQRRMADATEVEEEENDDDDDELCSKL